MMTKEQAESTAADIASEVILHDVPRRLHRHNVPKVYVIAVAQKAAEATLALEAAVLEYLMAYSVEEVQ